MAAACRPGSRGTRHGQPGQMELEGCGGTEQLLPSDVATAALWAEPRCSENGSPQTETLLIQLEKRCGWRWGVCFFPGGRWGRHRNLPVDPEYCTAVNGDLAGARFSVFLLAHSQCPLCSLEQLPLILRQRLSLTPGVSDLSACFSAQWKRSCPGATERFHGDAQQPQAQPHCAWCGQDKPPTAQRRFHLKAWVHLRRALKVFQRLHPPSLMLRLPKQRSQTSS